MKIQIPLVQADPNGGYTWTPTPISFSEVGPGKFKALVPVTFTGTSPNLRSVFPMTIETDASDAQKGKRRVMVKVSLPYRRGIVNPIGGQPQLGSDAGEISCHMVVSVPKALIQDLTVPDANNTNASIVASSTLIMVLQLLKSMSITTASGHPRPLTDSQSTDNKIQSIPAVEPGGYVPSDGTPTDIAPTTLVTDQIRFSTDSVSGAIMLKVPKGLMTFSGSAVGLDNAIFDPIVRGLFGMRPVEEDSAVVIPSTFVLES